MKKIKRPANIKIPGGIRNDSIYACTNCGRLHDGVDLKNALETDSCSCMAALNSCRYELRKDKRG